MHPHRVEASTVPGDLASRAHAAWRLQRFLPGYWPSVESRWWLRTQKTRLGSWDRLTRIIARRHRLPGGGATSVDEVCELAMPWDCRAGPRRSLELLSRLKAVCVVRRCVGSARSRGRRGIRDRYIPPSAWAISPCGGESGSTKTCQPLPFVSTSKASAGHLLGPRISPVVVRS